MLLIHELNLFVLNLYFLLIPNFSTYFQTFFYKPNIFKQICSKYKSQ